MPAPKELRYATVRYNRRGDTRWYWQRPGYPLTRLPDDLVERVALLQRLNAAADSERQPTVEPPRGSIGWVIQEYRASDDYVRLAVNSKKATSGTSAMSRNLGRICHSVVLHGVPSSTS